MLKTYVQQDIHEPADCWYESDRVLAFCYIIFDGSKQLNINLNDKWIKLDTQITF